MDPYLLMSIIDVCTGLFAGLALAALYYRPKVRALDGKLTAATRYAKAWRENACSIALDLAEMRQKLPQRDPRTNRFVKRQEVAN